MSNSLNRTRGRSRVTIRSHPRASARSCRQPDGGSPDPRARASTARPSGFGGNPCWRSPSSEATNSSGWATCMGHGAHARLK
jgi:hypothetical protein